MEASSVVPTVLTIPERKVAPGRRGKVPTHQPRVDQARSNRRNSNADESHLSTVRKGGKESSKWKPLLPSGHGDDIHLSNHCTTPFLDRLRGKLSFFERSRKKLETDGTFLAISSGGTNRSTTQNDTSKSAARDKRRANDEDDHSRKYLRGFDGILALLNPAFDVKAADRGEDALKESIDVMTPIELAEAVSGLVYVCRKMRILLDAMTLLHDDNKSHSLRTAVSGIINLTYAVMKPQRCTYYVIDWNTKLLRGYYCGDGDSSTQDLRQIILPVDKGIVGFSALTGTIINVKDAYSDPRFDKEMDRVTGFRTRCLMCVPVLDAADKTVGVIQVINKMDGSVFSDSEAIMIQYLAQCAGHRLRNSKTAEEAANKSKLSETLLEITKLVSTQTQLDDAVAVVIEQSYELMEAERITVFLVSPCRTYLEVRVGKGAAGFRIPSEKGIVGHVASTGEIVNIRNAYSDSRFDQSVDKRTGFVTRSILTCPVRRATGEICAVIQAINKRTEDFFDLSDEELLQGMASTVGRVVFSKTDDSKEKEISRIVHGAALQMWKRSSLAKRSIADFLKHTTNCMADIVKATSLRLYFVDESRGTLFSISNYNSQSHTIQTRLDAESKCALGRSVAMMKTFNFLFKDVRSDERIDLASDFHGFQSDHLDKIKCMLIVPIPERVNGGNSCLAVVQAYNKHKSSQTNGVQWGEDIVEFTSEDTIVLSKICDEVSEILTRLEIVTTVKKSLIQGNRKEILDGFLGFDNNDDDSIVVQSNDDDDDDDELHIGIFVNQLNHEHKRLSNLSFNVWDCTLEELIEMSKYVLMTTGSWQKIIGDSSASESKLHTFLNYVFTDGYKNLPFFNMRKGFMGLHFVHITLLRQSKSSSILSPYDRLATLIAALCVDLDHPGNNNDFHIASRSNLALLYNDQSVLENHHASATCRMLESIGIFQCTSNDIARKLRSTIVSCILATDPANHHTICRKISNCDPSTLNRALSRNDQLLIASALVVGSASSAFSRTADEALEWALRMKQEFYLQVVAETSLNMTPTKFMHRMNNGRGEDSRIFHDLILLVYQPFFHVLTRLHPDLQACTINLDSNREFFASLYNIDLDSSQARKLATQIKFTELKEIHSSIGSS